MKKITSLFILLLNIGLAATAQDSTYKELTGTYKFPPGSVIDEAVVTWENAVVTMTSSAGVSVLERIKGDTFNVVSFNGIAVFKRSDAKKVIGVHVDAAGYVLDGEKEGITVNNAISKFPVQPVPAGDKLNEKEMNIIRDAVITKNFSRNITGCMIP